jgi:hypothetical protein
MIDGYCSKYAELVLMGVVLSSAATVSAFTQLENLPPILPKCPNSRHLLVEKGVALVAAPHTTHRQV